MANNNVLKISPDQLGEVVNKLVTNKLMMITQQKPGQSPRDDKTGDNRHDRDWPPPAPLKPKLAHKGQHYGPHGRPIQDPAFGIDPAGNPIHMKHMEQTPEEHIRNREMHIRNYGPQASATSRQIRDRLKPFTKGSGYDDSGGSLRGIPDALRIQLLRDAKA
jgi:hypothetical protein